MQNTCTNPAYVPHIHVACIHDHVYSVPFILFPALWGRTVKEMCHFEDNKFIQDQNIDSPLFISCTEAGVHVYRDLKSRDVSTIGSEVSI